jgi:hypothetical protein
VANNAPSLIIRIPWYVLKHRSTINCLLKILLDAIMLELVHSSLEKNCLKYALHKTNIYLKPSKISAASPVRWKSRVYPWFCSLACFTVAAHLYGEFSSVFSVYLASQSLSFHRSINYYCLSTWHRPRTRDSTLLRITNSAQLLSTIHIHNHCPSSRPGMSMTAQTDVERFKRLIAHPVHSIIHPI